MKKQEVATKMKGVGKGPYGAKEKEIHALRYDRNHDKGGREHEEVLGKYRDAKKFYKASGTSSAHFKQ
jgi:hypothetical protein